LCDVFIHVFHTVHTHIWQYMIYVMYWM
jgi:hypothetical protein